MAVDRFFHSPPPFFHGKTTPPFPFSPFRAGRSFYGTFVFSFIFSRVDVQAPLPLQIEDRVFFFSWFSGTFLWLFLYVLYCASELSARFFYTDTNL